MIRPGAAFFWTATISRRIFLSRNIGMVTQETYLLRYRAGLLYMLGRRPLRPNDRRRAVRIHDFIASLPDGYEPLSGSAAISPAGGERDSESPSPA